MKKITLIFLTLLLLTCSVSSAGIPLDCNTVQGGKNADIVFSSGETFYVCGSSDQNNEINGYIKFDISTVDKKSLKKAMLTLYAYEDNNMTPLSLYSISNEWSGAELTWNKRPANNGFIGISTPSLMGTEGVFGAVHKFDITDAVMQNNQPFISVCIKDDSKSNMPVKIAGKEEKNTVLRPRIDLDYGNPNAEDTTIDGISDKGSVTFDLNGIKENIVQALYTFIPTNGMVPFDINVKQGESKLFKRSVCTLNKTMVLDVTKYVKKGEKISFSLECMDKEFKYVTPKLVLKTANFIGVARQEYFENNTINEFDGFETSNKSNISIVKNPNGDGNVMRTYLHNADGMVAGSKRTEIGRNSVGGIGQEMLYTFKIYIPLDFIVDSNLEIITQWHIAPDSNLGEVWRSPPLGMKITGEHFALSNRSDPKPKTEGNDPTPEGVINDNMGLAKWEAGKWTNWVYHVKWSCYDDGILQVYRDGKLVIDKKGANMYNDQSTIYMKHGIYKGSIANFREIMFDNSVIYYHNDVLKDVLVNNLPFAVKQEVNISDSYDFSQKCYNIENTIQNISGEVKEATVVTRLVNKATGAVLKQNRTKQIVMPNTVVKSKIGFTASPIQEGYQVISYVENINQVLISNKVCS